MKVKWTFLLAALMLFAACGRNTREESGQVGTLLGLRHAGYN